VIRRTLGAFAPLPALFLAASLAQPLAAQEVVGHLPDASPYSDATGRHNFTLGTGWIAPGRDPAGVSPHSGMLFLGIYEFDVPGPLLLTGRGGYAPWLRRDVKDPVFTGALQDAGEWPEPLFFFDAGLALSLTGDKAWRGLKPRAHTGIGGIASLQPDYDVGGYQFGPKLMLSYGFGTRYLVNRRYELDVDLTHAFWRMQYPGAYGDDESSVTPSLVGSGKLNPWNGNLMLTVSLTRVFGR
jgi:hypothetical protein